MAHLKKSADLKQPSLVVVHSWPSRHLADILSHTISRLQHTSNNQKEIQTSCRNGAHQSSSRFLRQSRIKYEQSFGHNEGLRTFIIKSLSLLPTGPDTTVLDIGSGTGIPTSSLVVSSGRKLHGIDFSPVMIELSKRQVPGGTFQLTNMLDFRPENPSQFQGAFAVFSLFHLSREETNRAAKKFSQWIAPGGCLFIGTMVAENFSTESAMFDEDGECARGIEHTFMGRRTGNLLYTKQGWVNLLRKVGFEAVNTEMVPFQAPPEADCDLEPHYYITARKDSAQ